MKNWNKDMIYLHVEEKNEAANRLYQSLGYKRNAEILSEFEKKLHGMQNITYYYKPLI